MESHSAQIAAGDIGHGNCPPRDAALGAGLRYSCDMDSGFRRKRVGRGFIYLDEDHNQIRDPRTLQRIRQIVIPPAWTDVWISRFGDSHLQATGRDDRGRKQYKYHPLFRALRESTKYEHLLTFAAALPSIRATVKKHIRMRGLPRTKVLATVVYLLEATLIRIGNRDYAKTNGSFGLTTLKRRHVAVNDAQLKFHFIGKSGKTWSVDMSDRRMARVIQACQDLPGGDLLQYLDAAGSRRKLTSADVNEYLHEITGHKITAKDFRTFGGTVLAAVALSRMGSFSSAKQGKRNVRTAITEVAARLGNTSTICRKCYVHPAVIDNYLAGSLRLDIKQANGCAHRPDLTAQERAVVALVRADLKKIAGSDARARHAPAR